MPHGFPWRGAGYFTSNSTSKQKHVFPCHNSYHHNKDHINISVRLAEVNYNNKKEKELPYVINEDTK
jgi:hypothetical protein